MRIRANLKKIGYANAFNVVNEIKNPIPTLKKNGALSILIVSLLYMLCNIAYFAAGMIINLKPARICQRLTSELL